DPLTDLPNRQRFTALLQEALAQAQAVGQYGAVVFLNLDNFRTVNKTLGHRNGDALLRLVGQRLAQALAPGQAAARVSGDEFLILMEEIGLTEDSTRARALAEAQRLVDMLAAPAAIGEFELQVTACAGIAIFSPSDPEKADELLAQVDLALFHAKSAGKGNLRFFEPAFQLAVAKKAALEADLAQALARAELSLHYQPQLDRHGAMVGVEALLRWKHAQAGDISPAVFIPIAEESGLILSIGQWVIETACATLARWARLPEMAHISMSVNVSAAQLRAQNFAERVATAVRLPGVNARLLKLELTESILVDDIDGIIEKMKQLRALGVGFSLDDFGTGYSSLAYLKQMPLEQLKIDQSFVRDIQKDPNDAAIARTIIALAHSLGLRVIAEGVETDAQRDFLFEADCDGYQGYLFSRPIPLAELERLVQRTGPQAMNAT
ncbi:MAG: hypothetical protein JWQ88_77, partial [Rhodoferax sp.]|nr:hypothetical protein [Rhodoferax sp.]